ncbi:MAG: nuclear transport factor 2 family protein [Dehalococcoidia bacterium]
MTTMPKHLTKGPYFNFLDQQHSTAGRAEILKKLRGGVPLADVGSVEHKGVDATDNKGGTVQRTRARKNHLNWHWFGNLAAIQPPSAANPAGAPWPDGTPFDPPNAYTTGWWNNWRGDAEGIMRCTFIRALEVALGLTHFCPEHPSTAEMPDSANPHKVEDLGKPIDYYWVCGVTRFEGYVSWNENQVTVIFLTPGFPYSIREYQEDDLGQLDTFAASAKGIIHVGQHLDCGSENDNATQMSDPVITHRLEEARGGSGQWTGAIAPKDGEVNCPKSPWDKFAQPDLKFGAAGKVLLSLAAGLPATAQPGVQTEAEVASLVKTMFHSEAVWVSDELPEGFAAGWDQIAKGFARLAAGFPGFQIVIDELSEPGGDRVAFSFRFSGSNTSFLAPYGITGRNVEGLRGSGFATVSDGVVLRLETHWNCLRALAQLGIRPYGRPNPVLI